MSEEQQQAENRKRPTTDEFRAFVAEDWAPRSQDRAGLTEAAARAAVRREAVSAAHRGERLVIPAGGLKVRSNDSDYVFRPHSAFAHLTGLGADREPDAVLVMEPLGGPTTTLTTSRSSTSVRSRPATPTSSSPTAATASFGSARAPRSRTSRTSSASPAATSTSSRTPSARTRGRSPCVSSATPTAT